MIRATASLLLGMAVVMVAGIWAARRLDPTTTDRAMAAARMRTVELASEVDDQLRTVAERVASEADAGLRAIAAQPMGSADDVRVPSGDTDALAAQGRVGAGAEVDPLGAADSAPEAAAEIPPGLAARATPPAAAAAAAQPTLALPTRPATAPPPNEGPAAPDMRASADHIRRMLAVYRTMQDGR